MRLLLTCRDVGSAYHFIEVYKHLFNYNIDCVVIAQEPAASLLIGAGIPVTICDYPAIKNRQSKQAEDLLLFVRKAVSQFNPDAVLCGLSTPLDGGIDEAVIVLEKGRTTTFVLQDFWGECNGFFGEIADHYLCLDHCAAALTRERYSVNTYVAGAAKYSQYDAYNTQDMRIKYRSLLSVDQDAFIIGYFGQALHGMAGYDRTVIKWIKSILRLSCRYHIVYKPHPRETPAEVQKTLSQFSKNGLDCTLLPIKMESKYAVSICDTIFSLFSTCSYDAAYMNYFSDIPFVVPVNLLFDQEIRSYYDKVVQITQTPFDRLGLALTVECDQHLGSVLEASFDPVIRLRIWQKSKCLPSPDGAAARIIKYIAMEAAFSI